MSDKSEKESSLINNTRTIEELANLTAIVRPCWTPYWKIRGKESSFTIVKDDEGVDK